MSRSMPTDCFASASRDTGWTHPAFGDTFDNATVASSACLAASASCAAISQEFPGAGWRMRGSGQAMVQSGTSLIERAGCLPPATPPAPTAPSWPPFPSWPEYPPSSGTGFAGSMGGGMVATQRYVAVAVAILVLAFFMRNLCRCSCRVPCRAPASTPASTTTGSEFTTAATSSKTRAAADLPSSSSASGSYQDQWSGMNDAALAASRGERATFKDADAAA